ncbi:MAG: hypothetical protein JOY62_16595 [Acidobacteriaceae bacterium]|nr:hypothetical protein [Acidobacteriaceae bacterium]
MSRLKERCIAALAAYTGHYSDVFLHISSCSEYNRPSISYMSDGAIDHPLARPDLCPATGTRRAVPAERCHSNRWEIYRPNEKGRSFRVGQAHGVHRIVGDASAGGDRTKRGSQFYLPTLIQAG